MYAPLGVGWKGGGAQLGSPALSETHGPEPVPTDPFVRSSSPAPDALPIWRLPPAPLGFLASVGIVVNTQSGGWNAWTRKESFDRDITIYAYLLDPHGHTVISCFLRHQKRLLQSKTKANISSAHSNQHLGRSSNQSTSESELGLVENDYKFIEQFNRDMMDQFMEHQRRTQV